MMLSHGNDANVDYAAFGTIGGSSFLGLVGIYFVLVEDGPTEGFARFLGVVLIVTVLGTIVTPLLNKTMNMAERRT